MIKYNISDIKKRNYNIVSSEINTMDLKYNVL